MEANLSGYMSGFLLGLGGYIMEIIEWLHVGLLLGLGLGWIMEIKAKRRESRRLVGVVPTKSRYA